MTRLACLVVCLLSLPAAARADEPDGPEDAHSVAPPPAPPPHPLPPPQQQPPPRAVVPAVLLAQIQHLEQSGRRMRAGGGVLLALGIASEITGQVLLLHSQLTTTPTDCTTTRGVTSCAGVDYHVDELGTGIALGLAGAGMIYGGLAVLSAGSGRVRRAELLKLQVMPEVTASRIGLHVALRF